MPKCHFRSWQRQEDTLAIYEMAAQLPDEVIASAALPYQLSSWATDDPNNLALWTTSDGTLMAFALFQIPFASLVYAIHPDAEQATLENKIFAWSKQRAQSLAKQSGKTVSYSVWVAEKQTATHERLAALDFDRQAGIKVFFEQALDKSIPTPVLPPGFVVRPLAGSDEVEAATTLLCEAFQIDTVTVPWRRRILEQPSYRPDLDLVIAAPDGRLAAFCLLWLHPYGKRGQIEPMATHPDFQRLGLGRAAIFAGLAQLAALGARQAVVGTSGSNFRSQGMYQSAGFRVQHRRVGYSYHT